MIYTDNLKKAVEQTWPVALWVGGSAALTYFLTALLNRPDLVAYYGLINVALVLVNEFSKAYAKK